MQNEELNRNTWKSQGIMYLKQEESLENRDSFYRVILS